MEVVHSALRTALITTSSVWGTLIYMTAAVKQSCLLSGLFARPIGHGPVINVVKDVSAEKTVLDQKQL